MVRVKLTYNNYISPYASLVDVYFGIFSYVSTNTQIRNAEIGKFCSIADNVKVGLGFHPVNFISTHPAFYSVGKKFLTFSDSQLFDEYRRTTIGNDVWIGSNVLIVGGIKIGDGAILASGSIVTKDVEPYAIMGGNPCKLIRYRFESDLIEKLLNFKWWDKDLKWIEDNYTQFNDKEKFLNLIGTGN
jgi:acetyltransferase-like isoleucine patch superfamily enzyme